MGVERHKLYCSFCGKSQHEVLKLIAGPTVFICNECVDLCNEIIDEEMVVPDDSPRLMIASDIGLPDEPLDCLLLEGRGFFIEWKLNQYLTPSSEQTNGLISSVAAGRFDIHPLIAAYMAGRAKQFEKVD